MTGDIEGHRDRENYLDVLRVLYSRLRGTDVNWVVSGSLSVFLQGVELEVHDIDIETDKQGAYAIERLFPEYLVKSIEYSSTEKVHSYLGVLIIDGIRVEIIGDLEWKFEDGTWKAPANLKSCTANVEIESMRLPVVTLQHMQDIYVRWGRREKAEHVRNFLDRRS